MAREDLYHVVSRGSNRWLHSRLLFVFHAVSFEFYLCKNTNIS